MKKSFISLVVVALLLIILVIPAVATTDQTQDAVHNQIVNVPPANWNPLKASDEELRKYAYPPRPTNSEEFHAWESIVSGGKWIKPEFKKSGILHERPKRNKIENAQYQYGNYWSGVMNKASASRVTGQWVIPSAFYSDITKRPAYNSEWIGIGGSDVTYDLIQAGTNCDAMSIATFDYSAWYEILGTGAPTGGAVNIPNFQTSAGDTMYEDISYNPNTKLASFYIYDVTSGYVTSFSVNLVSTSNLTTSAEWICERQRVGGNPAYYLTKYGTANFSECQWGQYNTGVSYVSPTSPNLVYCYVQGTNGTISNPSTVGSTGNFSCTWYGYS
jgi:hypothetical protein